MDEVHTGLDVESALQRANQRLRNAYHELDSARAAQLLADELRLENAELVARLADCHRQIAELVVQLENASAADRMQLVEPAVLSSGKASHSDVAPRGIVARLRRYWERLLLRRRMAKIRRSGLFDPAWYLTQNPDVAAAGMDPVEHYLLFGCREGREVNPYLSLAQYVSRNPDAYADPLGHLMRKRNRI